MWFSVFIILGLLYHQGSTLIGDGDIKRNIALKGKSKQSSTVRDVFTDYIADLAIDNDPQTCSLTSRDTGGNWTIDLGAVHTIAHFIIDTGHTFFGSTFELHTAERPNGSFVLCNYGDQAEEILDEYKVKCVDGARLARFITIKNLKRGGVKLCEFKAIECGDGYFGDDCVKICHCDGGRVCDKKSGACPDNVKCASGYNGANCQEACKEGTFGSGCSNICHCLEGVSCDPMTGECPGHFCAHPWTGATCQEISLFCIDLNECSIVQLPSIVVDEKVELPSLPIPVIAACIAVGLLIIIIPIVIIVVVVAVRNHRKRTNDGRRFITRSAVEGNREIERFRTDISNEINQNNQQDNRDRENPVHVPAIGSRNALAEPTEHQSQLYEDMYLEPEGHYESIDDQYESLSGNERRYYVNYSISNNEPYTSLVINL